MCWPSRLSENPENQVLLLEYGGRATNPVLYVPKGFYFTVRGDRYTYHYPTQPVGPGGQAEVWTRGKVLGGSTAVNGMMWMRGAAADWDGLAARGNPAFGWEGVLAAYRTMEGHNLGASDMRGAGGPLGVSVTEDDDELAQAILASAQGMGWEYVADANAHDSERIGFSPSTIRARPACQRLQRLRWRQAMGPAADDVVDPQLRVRGVTGLRVVDASVLPVQVAGNTAAPTMAVAWIAADLILEGS